MENRQSNLFDLLANIQKLLEKTPTTHKKTNAEK